MMTFEPLVTINILSYNRKDELRQTLKKVYEQGYKNIEVIVVDNASSDGTPEMVEEEFPTLKLIKLDKNIGIAGWNEGFKVAKGEYILVLDDDSYPKNNTIRNGITKLEAEHNIAIIACRIISNTHKKLESGLEMPFLESSAITFTGCGAIIRKSVIEKIGGFEKELFIYFHEVEFSMRVINLGWDILYYPYAVVIHNLSPSNRKFDSNLVDNRKVFYDVRNLLLIIYLHFPFTRSIFLTIRIILGRILYGIHENKLIIILTALKSAFSRIVILKTQRNIINRETQARYLYGSFAGGLFFCNTNYGLKRPKWLELH